MHSLRFIIPVLMIITGGCSGTTGDIAEKVNGNLVKPSIYFDDLTHDFGRIDEGEKVAFLFKFKNQGETDLLINSVTTSCGCTVPRFSEEPVSPGEDGTIEVIFDSAYREGIQTKTIQVRSNADVPVVLLRITAEIITNK